MGPFGQRCEVFTYLTESFGTLGSKREGQRNDWSTDRTRKQETFIFSKSAKTETGQRRSERRKTKE